VAERNYSTAFIVSIVAVWIVIVAAGLFALSQYKSEPGELAAAPSEWPGGSALHRVPGRSTLVMMSHPRCPCSRASIAELEILLARFGDRVTAYVLFIEPNGSEFDWSNTDLWRSAKRIPRAQVIRDKGGVEAARFDALTSGQVVLYDAAGRLQFNGGITGVRGHVGDNLGLQRVMSLLGGAEADRADSPVFGCPLHNEEE
jgi:hypothetical protein